MQTSNKVDLDFPKHLQLMDDQLQVIVSEWTTSDRFDFEGLEEGNYMVKVSSSFGAETSGVIGVSSGAEVGRTIIIASPRKKRPNQLAVGSASPERKIGTVDETVYRVEERDIRISRKKSDQRLQSGNRNEDGQKRMSLSFTSSESWNIKMRPSGASVRKSNADRPRINYARLELWSFAQGRWGRISYKRINLDQLKTSQRLLEYDAADQPRMLVATSDLFARRTVMCPLYDQFDLNLGWQEVADPSVHPLTMVLTIENQKADALLTLLSRGSFNDAKSFMESPIAEQLLWGKVDDPVGAAVGGYYLLLARDLDRLHDWANNLANMFDWLPDGPIIHAWQMITKGKNGEKGVTVRSRLLQAFERGVPLCTQGMRFLFEGLDQLSSISEGRDVEVEVVLNKLRAYIQRTDWLQKMTTFNGATPGKDGKWPLLDDTYNNFNVLFTNDI